MERGADGRDKQKARTRPGWETTRLTHRPHPPGKKRLPTNHLLHPERRNQLHEDCIVGELCGDERRRGRACVDMT